MRARLALLSAGYAPGLQLEIREVSLQAKPPELLALSAKATVPVLQVSENEVLEESLAIMAWALGSQLVWVDHPLVLENDGPFKHHLDRFKYPDRYPGVDPLAHRRAGLEILRSWQEQLARPLPGGAWLMGKGPGWLDWALLPFVRQFRLANPQDFDAEPELALVQAWLQRFLGSAELAAVMAPPWAERRPWPSPVGCR